MFRNALAIAARPSSTLRPARSGLYARRDIDLASRAISTSPTLLAKAGSSKTSSGSKKSMAERPSDVPDDITAPGEVRRAPVEETFEPIVNDMRSTEGPHTVNASSGVTSTSDSGDKPLETGPSVATPKSSVDPIATPASQIPEEPYQIPDQPDLSKLPSLDFGLDEPAKAAPKIESPTGSEDSIPGSRTGAKAKPSLSSIEQRRRNFTRFMLLSGLLGSGIGAYYLATKDDEAKIGEAEALGAWEKFKNNFTGLLDVSLLSTMCRLVERSLTLCIWDVRPSTSPLSTSFSPMPCLLLTSEDTPF